MKNLLILLVCVLATNTFGLNSNEINRNLGSINNKITQINSQLTKQQNQQKNIDDAIKYSDSAISQSNQLLEQLKQQKAQNLAKLNEVQTSLNALNQSLNNTKTQTNILLTQIYKKLAQIQNQKQSFMLQDNSNNNLKKNYLLAILQTEKKQLLELQNKIDELNQLNTQIQNKINQINSKLNNTKNQQTNLQHTKQQQLTKSNQLETNIKNTQQKLQTLKQQQIKLNELMNQIIAQENTAKLKKAQKQKTQMPTAKLQDKSLNEDTAIEQNSSFNDNSKFSSRSVVKPINANITLGFGKVKDNVTNKGILYSYVENANVKSISNGKVMYNGILPGFGTVVIVDHGDNYMSIYSGIISNLKLGTKVNTGEVIGNTGTKDNEPMGGFYFEIRHLGKAIDPSQIIG